MRLCQACSTCLIFKPHLVQEDHCLSQVGGALHRLAQNRFQLANARSLRSQEPPSPQNMLSTCAPEPRRSHTRCESMAVPPVGTHRTSRSSCAGAASARGLSGQLLRKTEPKTSHHPAQALLTVLVAAFNILCILQ